MTSRRGFLSSIAAGAASTTLPGCVWLAEGTGDPTPEELREWSAKWHYWIDPPEGWVFDRHEELVATYDCHPDCTIELWRQNCGPGGRVQRVVKAIPRNLGAKDRAPAVVAPFYIPEMLLGCEIDDPSKEVVCCSLFMRDFVRRGYVVVSNDCFHENYCPCPGLKRNNFGKWKVTGKKILTDWPTWSPMALKVHDAMLTVDLLCRDARVDARRIAAVGHSLGGQSAFYVGCWDDRIKAMLCSDFTFLFSRSWWDISWYWGGKLEAIEADGLENAQLLSLSGAKPFMCIAGWYDDDSTWQAMLRAKGYAGHREDLVFINHASGHAPPAWTLEKGYRFIDRHLGHVPPAKGERI